MGKAIHSYVDRALANTNLGNIAELEKALGVTPLYISSAYEGATLPDEETIVAIADAAGMCPRMALIDLNIWRSKDRPEIQAVYRRIYVELGFDDIQTERDWPY